MTDGPLSALAVKTFEARIGNGKWNVQFPTQIDEGSVAAEDRELFVERRAEDGSKPSTQERSGFEKMARNSGTNESVKANQARYSASDDDYRLFGGFSRIEGGYRH